MIHVLLAQSDIQLMSNIFSRDITALHDSYNSPEPYRLTHDTFLSAITAFNSSRPVPPLSNSVWFHIQFQTSSSPNLGVIPYPINSRTSPRSSPSCDSRVRSGSLSSSKHASGLISGQPGAMTTATPSKLGRSLPSFYLHHAFFGLD